MGNDLSVVRAARVSYGNDTKSEDQDRKLLKYLLVNRHTSPFEHVMFTFRVEAPIFVARQWMRHRTWSFNEVSYRYTEAPEEVWHPEVWRGQSTDNKQMSRGTLSGDTALDANDVYEIALTQARWAYSDLLQLGIAREQARAVLPVATMTSFYGTVDLHNLLHFLDLRLHPHAQPEIREYAEAIVDLIRPIVPWTLEIWEGLRNERAEG